jgi:hypothetical protein
MLHARRFVVHIPADARCFLFFKTSRPDLGPIRSSIQRVPDAFSPCVVCKVGHLPPSCVEVQNEWRHTFTPPMFLSDVCRKSFTFYDLLNATAVSTAFPFILRPRSTQPRDG